MASRLSVWGLEQRSMEAGVLFKMKRDPRDADMGDVSSWHTPRPSYFESANAVSS